MFEKVNPAHPKRKLLNEYDAALDIIARYISDLKRDIDRTDPVELGNALEVLSKLVGKTYPAVPRIECTDEHVLVPHCPTCDAVINTGDTYCKSCGQRLTWE